MNGMGYMTSKISAWFDEGVRRGASHLIVIVDSVDETVHPVYRPTPNATRSFVAWPGESCRVREVFDLRADKDEQMAERRTWRMPPQDDREEPDAEVTITVSGPPGVGKSTVIALIAESLRDAGVADVAVEADQRDGWRERLRDSVAPRLRATLREVKTRRGGGEQ